MAVSKIFDDVVKDMIHDQTGGVPRAINNLAVTCLIGASASVGNQLRFVCPVCQESQTSVNNRTNLARCFRCELNWNPIDFTMTATNCEFRQAVPELEDLLPPT